MTEPVKALTEAEIDEIEKRIASSYNFASWRQAMADSSRLLADLRRIRNEQVCPEHAGLIEKFMEATTIARAQFERIKKLDAAIAAVRERRKIGTIYAALRHAGAKPKLVLEAQNKLKLVARVEDVALEALEEKPVPMCRRDTDGDGNCPSHPNGCPNRNPVAFAKSFPLAVVPIDLNAPDTSPAAAATPTKPDPLEDIMPPAREEGRPA